MTASTRRTVHRRTPLFTIAALLAALAVPVVVAPTPAPAQPIKRLVRKNKKKIRKNKKKIRKNKRKINNLSNSGSQLAGTAAGGDLTGTYPDPTVRPGAIGAAKLANGAVQTAKIVAGAVTRGKIADGAVNSAKVADDSLTGADIDESTLGKVPNADKLDGHTAGEFQPLVAGGCGAKEAIQGLGADGSITCVGNADQVDGYDVVPIDWIGDYGTSDDVFFQHDGLEIVGSCQSDGGSPPYAAMRVEAHLGSGMLTIGGIGYDRSTDSAVPFMYTGGTIVPLGQHFTTTGPYQGSLTWRSFETDRTIAIQYGARPLRNSDVCRLFGTATISSPAP